MTEANTNRAAACRYNSTDSNLEEEVEEMAISGEYFDLNMLSDTVPHDLYNIHEEVPPLDGLKLPLSGVRQDKTPKPVHNDQGT